MKRGERARAFVCLIACSLFVGLSVNPCTQAADGGSTQKTNADAAQDSSGGIASLSLDKLQADAVQLLLDGKADEAEKLVLGALKTESNVERRSELNYLVAAMEKMADDNDDAVKHLQEALNGEPPAKTPDEHFRRALLLRRIGDCYYEQRNYKQAISTYKDALEQCSALPKDSPATAPAIESMMGALTREKRFGEAETYAKQLVQVTSERADSANFNDMGRLFWAQLQLLGIYRSTGQEAERLKQRAVVAKVFDQLLNMRYKLEEAGTLPKLADAYKSFQTDYINEFKPKTAAEYLWLADEFKMRTLPLIGWRPKEENVKAVILCVHGLGLESRAFTAFGREMANRGFQIYAMDVRGFGAWQATPGQEELSFRETINDIGGVIGLLKERHPGLPVFLLGESMGGAIALRAGAKYEGSFDGIISSVPSPERYQGRRMALSVAAHFLKGPNKEFSIGDMVATKATSREDLQQLWQSDKSAKLQMSPKELMRFDVFMRTTKRECEHIKTTPVFVLQGLKDRLVKPQGTYELFDAVTGDDKNMFIIGTAEHLIFENDRQSVIVLNALTTWINDHVTKTDASKLNLDNHSGLSASDRGKKY